VNKPDINMNQQPIDRVVQLLNLGFSEKEVYKDMLEHCSISLDTESKKRSMRYLIAQTNKMNVFATGEHREPI
jgi:hypothetical protein